MAKSRNSQSAKKKSYRHPVPKRTDILDFLRDVGKPVTVDVLIRQFGIKGQRMQTQFLDALRKMVRHGQVIENRRGEFCLVERIHLHAGMVIGHRDGFGFLKPDDGDDDIYLSAAQMRSVFHGDRAAVKIVGEDRRGRPEGKVVEVLERGVREVAGQFIRERGVGVVIPDNSRIAHRILIARRAAGEAKPGQVVVARSLH